MHVAAALYHHYVKKDLTLKKNVIFYINEARYEKSNSQKKRIRHNSQTEKSKRQSQIKKNC